MKRRRGFFSNRHGITPVLSNLLLMVVAVAVMSIATTATYVITTNLRETMSERFVIEDVWFENSTIGIYIRNVGKNPIQISTVYINSTRYFFSPTPFNLGMENHRWLNISINWVSGSVYRIDVVTLRGNHAEDYYKAP
jgi:hypothetical protein